MKHGDVYFSHEVMQCNRYQSTAEVTRCSERRTRLSWVAGAALSVPAPKTLHWSEAYSKEAAQCHASTYLVREMWVRRNVYPNPSNVASSSPTKVFPFELYSFVQCFIVRSNDRYALAVHTDCSATLDDHAFVLVGLPDVTPWHELQLGSVSGLACQELPHYRTYPSLIYC